MEEGEGTEKNRHYTRQWDALRAAFPYTIPVLSGFLMLGMAFGILMDSKGYGGLWPPLVSAFVFAGSMQFVAVGLLADGFAPVSLLMITLMVNARHLFYGISLLSQYRDTGWMKPYLIFGLCDETYSILCTTQQPQGVDRRWFMFFVTLLHQSYWVLGSGIGSFLGMVIPFSPKGIDFALTALFVVLFLGQWTTAKDKRPSVIGVAGTVLCRLVFGAESFLVPSLLVILLLMTVMRKPLEGGREG